MNTNASISQKPFFHCQGLIKQQRTEKKQNKKNRQRQNYPGRKGITRAAHSIKYKQTVVYYN